MGDSNESPGSCQDKKLESFVSTLASELATFEDLLFLFGGRHDKLHYQYSGRAKEIDQLKAVIASLKSSVEFEIKSKAKVAECMHNFYHEYSKQIHRIISDLANSDYSQLKGRIKSFQSFNLFMLANIKEIFDILTHDECAVCIKTLDEKEIIRTHLRDSVSYRKRSESDILLSEYPYHDNTAFKIMMEGNYPDYYLCNDLKAEYGYNNRNQAWPNLYNACLDVAIRKPKEVGNPKPKTTGFICVDNFKGGFNLAVGYEILASFCDCCFHLFSVYNELGRRAKEH